jgi:3'-phosphoadenosine 5'-phosphosulfate sulfotransferase (PAPS reductase)/FAD synthetase
MAPDPYRVEPPALVSFSGGRTSAFMLHEILRAYDGALPDGVVVAFDNTGKEREETLRFVHECASRWGVQIHWLEWRPRPTEGRPDFAGAALPPDEWERQAAWWDAAVERCGEAGFEEVGFNSASRAGEPFRALIALRQFAPNAVTRFCSQKLKVEAGARFGKSLGWTRWVNVIGLRYDEGHRVLKALARNDSGKEPFKAAMPLAKAHVTKRDVMRFWLGSRAAFPSDELPQGFDLGLRDYEGNCDLCFLKSRAKKLAIIREQPGAVDWWIAMEQLVRQKATGAGGRFVTEYSYAELAREVAAQPHLFDDLADEEHDAECGLLCGAA